MRLMRTNIFPKRSCVPNRRGSSGGILTRSHLALYLLAVCLLAGTVCGTTLDRVFQVLKFCSDLIYFFKQALPCGLLNLFTWSFPHRLPHPFSFF